jgi:hypothetical protein
MAVRQISNSICGIAVPYLYRLLFFPAAPLVALFMTPLPASPAFIMTLLLGHGFLSRCLFLAADPCRFIAEKNMYYYCGSVVFVSCFAHILFLVCGAGHSIKRG